MTDYWLVIFDLKENKQFTKYFNSEFEKDKYKWSLKYKTRYLVLEDSHQYMFSD